VEEDSDLSFEEAKRASDGFVLHALDHLELEEMVSAAERAELVLAALLRAVGDAKRGGLLELTVGFDPLEIAKVSEAHRDRRAGTACEHVVHLCVRKLHAPVSTEAGRDGPHELVHDAIDVDLRARLLRGEQTHAAIDVEADAPR
jgi:hypothetical protein